ncbi:MAG: gliding motility-associated C-terminal domain-containing protein, partial [Salibacteraceae bacterium]|nr:gliding motility-associated C-terminal domain-containing protein [Salibacteraceae bacterium]
NIFVPNYLTPNGDGVNDLFRAILPEHTCFTLYVYNRWGALVHLSHHINIGWDGAIRNTGEPAAEGTYYYLIEYCTIHEDNLIAKGSLTLIRE